MFRFVQKMKKRSFFEAKTDIKYNIIKILKDRYTLIYEVDKVKTDKRK